MSIIEEETVTEIESLQFFQTQPHKCSYIAKEKAATVFLNPRQKIDNALYSRLSEHGFRRSGQHIYRPHCPNCDACIPMRIPAQQFKPSRQQKRTWKRNQDLTAHIVETIDTEEHYALYERYITLRHEDGDMFPPSREQFQSFLADSWQFVRYYEFRQNGRLIACSVADQMDNGLSAVYTYFDPDEARRSLGSFAILYMIEAVKEQNLPFLYLGYWIKSSPKMQYKSAYRPLEILNGDKWLTVL